MRKAGEPVSYVVTHLEMTRRPEGPFPPLPAGAPVLLTRSVAPPLRWFLHLYDSVGEGHEWTDRHEDDPEDLLAFLHDDDVALFAMMLDGWAGGFFLLDWRAPGVCDLGYFGLVPEAQGRGLGKWLLGEAIRMGWEMHGIARMTVNTNSLDHPRALPLYQRMGFRPVRREERTRILARDLPD